MPSNDEIMDTRLAAVRQLATLPDGAFNPDGLAWAAAYRQDVTALRARLTTAEQERDGLSEAWAQQTHRALAAEARVEAAEQERAKAVVKRNMAERDYHDAWKTIAPLKAALAQAIAEIEGTPFQSEAWGWGIANRIEEWRTLARAALACPPQQRGEEDGA